MTLCSCPASYSLYIYSHRKGWRRCDESFFSMKQEQQLINNIQSQMKWDVDVFDLWNGFSPTSILPNCQWRASIITILIIILELCNFRCKNYYRVSAKPMCRVNNCMKFSAKSTQTWTVKLNLTNTYRFVQFIICAWWIAPRIATFLSSIPMVFLHCSTCFLPRSLYPSPSIPTFTRFRFQLFLNFLNFY